MARIAGTPRPPFAFRDNPVLCNSEMTKAEIVRKGGWPVWIRVADDIVKTQGAAALNKKVPVEIVRAGTVKMLLDEIKRLEKEAKQRLSIAKTIALLQ